MTKSKAVLTALLGAWVLTALAALPARAAEEKPHTPAAYVVLVGVSEYADQQIAARPHAEDDVKALYDLFTNKDYLGVGDDHVRLLLGKADAKRHSQPATRDNILKALAWLRDETKRDDLVIFAFVGQGAPVGDQGDRLCYYASDSTVKDRAKNAVAAAEIAERLDKMKSQRFCAFIDLSFRGTGAKEPFGDTTSDVTPYREFLGNEGKEDHSAQPGRVVFLATSGRTLSLDLPKHGLLTQVALDGLKGAADKEGYEPDGVVTVDELTEYIDKELPALARKYGKTKEQKEQLHYVLGGKASHFVLTHNPSVAAKVQKRLDQFNQLVKDKKVAPDVAAEGEKLLSQMPKLEAQRSLRKQYQQLADGTITPEQLVEKRQAILDDTKLNRKTAVAYAKRVMEGVKVIQEGYVKEVNQGEMVGWAIRGLYRRIDEKLPADVVERLGKVKGMKESELTDLLADVREGLGKREDLENHKDIDYSLQRMLTHLDPYTTYFDSETVERMKADIGGSFTGIGIQIRKDQERDMLQVVTPIKDSPAYKAGIQAGDIITRITREVDSNGKPLAKPEVIETKGMNLSDAVKKILGQPKTEVKITIEREGESQPLEFAITRGRVELESVLGAKRKSDDTWDYWIDPVSKIGYIRLTQFSRNSFRDMYKVVKDLNDQKVQGLILDLRFNPGGLLDSAVRISDMFIDGGKIVTIRPRVGREHTYVGEMKKPFTNFPMVCLVNGGSASGSEIVSACLQDHHRAVIMGERSYGKGSVQNIQPFEGGELKLTTASFWRPSDKNLNKSSTTGKDDDEWGVTPDKGHLISLSPKERGDLQEHQRDLEIIKRRDAPEKEPKSEFKDKQLDSAVEYLKNQIKTVSRDPAKKAG